MTTETTYPDTHKAGMQHALDIVKEMIVAMEPLDDKFPGQYGQRLSLLHVVMNCIAEQIDVLPVTPHLFGIGDKVTNAGRRATVVDFDVFNDVTVKLDSDGSIQHWFATNTSAAPTPAPTMPEGHGPRSDEGPSRIATIGGQPVPPATSRYVEVECNRCHGKGSFRCWNCNGTGETADEYGNDLPCPTCQGEGRENCLQCKGTGKMEVERETPATEPEQRIATSGSDGWYEATKQKEREGKRFEHFTAHYTDATEPTGDADTAKHMSPVGQFLMNSKPSWLPEIEPGQVVKSIFVQDGEITVATQPAPVPALAPAAKRGKLTARQWELITSMRVRDAHLYAPYTSPTAVECNGSYYNGRTLLSLKDKGLITKISKGDRPSTWQLNDAGNAAYEAHIAALAAHKAQS